MTALTTFRFSSHLLLLLGWLVFAPGTPAFADSDDPGCHQDQEVINLIAENDLWGNGSDRHFTHGTRLSYVSRDISSTCQDEDPGLWEDFRSFAQELAPSILDLDTSRFSLILGQNIFTPENISRTDLILNDRPYAGWLYVGLGFMKERSDKVFDNFEIDIGVIGPGSIADEVQIGWHDVIDTTEPRGWANQLDNEPGILLTYERKWRLVPPETEALGLNIDFMPHMGAALGNVYTYFATGGTLRIGMHLEADYGPPRIRPGVQGSDFFKKPNGTFGWYIFGGVEGRAVGRNVFLDGNTFESSHSVNKKTLVGDFQAGLVITFKSFRLAFTNIFRTDEFDGQNQADEFGSISASYRF